MVSEERGGRRSANATDAARGEEVLDLRGGHVGWNCRFDVLIRYKNRQGQVLRTRNVTLPPEDE